MLPIELPPDRREMVLMAGRASYMMATRNTAAAEKAFQALVARYPETPNVHYAYGVFLLQEQPGQGDRGVQARARAAARSPVVADADRLRVREARRREDGAAVGEAGRRRRAERVPGPQGARPGAARDRRRRRRDPRAARPASSSRPRAPGCISRSRAPTSAPGRLEDANGERDEFTRLDRLARTQRAARSRSADTSSERALEVVATPLPDSPRSEGRPNQCRAMALRMNYRRALGSGVACRRGRRWLLSHPPPQQRPQRHQERCEGVTAVLVDVVVRDGAASRSAI